MSVGIRDKERGGERERGGGGRGGGGSIGGGLCGVERKERLKKKYLYIYVTR